MKVKVKSIFRDKYTNEKYKIGTTLEVNSERYEEVKAYVEKIEEGKIIKKRKKSGEV